MQLGHQGDRVRPVVDTLEPITAQYAETCRRRHRHICPLLVFFT